MIRVFVSWDHSNWPKAVVIPRHNLYSTVSVVTKLVKLKKYITSRNSVCFSLSTGLVLGIAQESRLRSVSSNHPDNASDFCVQLKCS